ncbi:MAG: sigma-70 family RNA polymerase sigma factor [Planctomycetes bacterium]|nr:sigma-70 family RNA polymerase sigma factor [Planctomycetota bacterium]
MENTTKLSMDRQAREEATQSGPADWQARAQVELVERARQGDKASLEKLAAMARERLRVYVYRLTQKDDLTQEIVQESLLEMCKILGKLQKTDRFWPWLYGIATNKLHRHYRTEKAMRHAAAAEERRRQNIREREEGFEGLISEELKQIVSNAMQKLRTRHKAVLVMRCYDGMSYGEIAESMGCNEFSTRMLFVRAKRALQKELLRKGFGRGSLLAALIVFGKMTAPSKAAAAQLTVPAAALKVGLGASVAGLATSATGIVSLAAAGALTVGTVVTTSNLRSTQPPSSSVSITSGAASPYATSSTAHQQFWYYFPNGPQGALMLRAQSRTSPNRVLQNDRANYTFENGTVHINNYRMWLDDLSVFKLPTDSTEMRGFLAQVEGIRNDIPPAPGSGKGLLTVVERQTETAGASRPWTIRNPNVLDADYFQSDWPSGAQIVDHRDAMHQRGWTWFRVRGNVRDRTITGTGRIPFTYAAARQHNAWMKLRIGDAMFILDGGGSASLQDAQGTALAQYPQGSFFKGLSQPWMGLHTIDSVRRDAAERRAGFETQVLSGGGQARVTVLSGKTRLVYLIDLEADLVRQIDLWTNDAPVGTLEFEYLQDVNIRLNEFADPPVRSERTAPRNSSGMLWLVRLAEGNLGG